MKIEDVKIEDAADANYVIRKFFDDQLKNMKMSQLEQLVLTVYNMGKNNGGVADSASSVEPAPASAPVPVPVPFKIGDRVKAMEDIEIGHSGVFVKTDTEGTVSSVIGDNISFLFESGEDGEMIEASVSFDKFEKIT